MTIYHSGHCAVKESKEKKERRKPVKQSRAGVNRGKELIKNKKGISKRGRAAAWRLTLEFLRLGIKNGGVFVCNISSVGASTD